MRRSTSKRITESKEPPGAHNATTRDRRRLRRLFRVSQLYVLAAVRFRKAVVQLSTEEIERAREIYNRHPEMHSVGDVRKALGELNLHMADDELLTFVTEGMLVTLQDFLAILAMKKRKVLASSRREDPFGDLIVAFRDQGSGDPKSSVVLKKSRGGVLKSSRMNDVLSEFGLQVDSASLLPVSAKGDVAVEDFASFLETNDVSEEGVSVVPAVGTVPSLDVETETRTRRVSMRTRPTASSPQARTQAGSENVDRLDPSARGEHHHYFSMSRLIADSTASPSKSTYSLASSSSPTFHPLSSSSLTFQPTTTTSTPAATITTQHSAEGSNLHQQRPASSLSHSANKMELALLSEDNTSAQLHHRPVSAKRIDAFLERMHSDATHRETVRAASAAAKRSQKKPFEVSSVPHDRCIGQAPAKLGWHLAKSRAPERDSSMAEQVTQRPQFDLRPSTAQRLPKVRRTDSRPLGPSRPTSNLLLTESPPPLLQLRVGGGGAPSSKWLRGGNLSVK